MQIKIYKITLLTSYIIAFSCLFPFNTICATITDSKKNVKFKGCIESVIDLNGAELICTPGDTIIFNGGQVINGTVVFNNTKVINPCFENCRFKGCIAETMFNVNDFGVLPGNIQDCSTIINDLIKLQTITPNANNPKHLYFPQGTYNIDKPIELFAGFDSPITLFGDGNMSAICQRSNNEYVIKTFEQNHIKNLRITYKQKQTLNDIRAVAIACQRSIFSIFENLTICNAHTAFGYIAMSDQRNGYNPTGYQDQCYVSDNFRNIRIYGFSGYAFDFRKEIPQGDSGSSYDNIYISNSEWFGERSKNASVGAIRGDNTVAAFTQLNIEGKSYRSPLIALDGFSRISISSLHIEGIHKIPSIAKAIVQSMLYIDIIDIQLCTFSTDNYGMFVVNDNAIIQVQGVCIRPDCLFEKNRTYNLLDGVVNGKNFITIAHILDGTHILNN